MPQISRRTHFAHRHFDRETVSDLSRYLENFVFEGGASTTHGAYIYTLTLDPQSKLKDCYEVIDDSSEDLGEIKKRLKEITEEREAAGKPKRVNGRKLSESDELASTRSSNPESSARLAVSGAEEGSDEATDTRTNNSRELEKPFKTVFVCELTGGFECLGKLLAGPQSAVGNKIFDIEPIPEDESSFGTVIEGYFDVLPEKLPADTSNEQGSLSVYFPYLVSLTGENTALQLKPLDRRRYTGQIAWDLTSFQEKKGCSPAKSASIGVERACIINFNKDLLLVSRTRERRAHEHPVFPKQERLGGFHILAHMIRDFMRSSDYTIIHQFKELAADYELRILEETSQPTRAEVREVLLQINRVKLVTEGQLDFLAILEDKFARAVPDYRKSSAHYGIYSTNRMEIPVVSGNLNSTTKQLYYATEVLGETIQERTDMIRELGSLIRRIEKTQPSKSSEKQTAVLKGELGDQRAKTQALYDEISWQRRTLDALGVVSVIFLPLNFFSQYFDAGDELKRNGKVSDSLGNFWKVTGSATALITLVALLYMIHERWEMRQIGRWIVDFRPWLDNDGIASRQLASKQKAYLRRLRKYRVVLRGTDTSAGGQVYYLASPKYPYDQPRSWQKTINLVERESEAGVFAYDDERGFLLHSEVDRNDFTYHARVKFTEKHGGSVSVGTAARYIMYWKRSRDVTEQRPWRFEGKFSCSKTEGRRTLEWVFSGTQQRLTQDSRWDNTRVIVGRNFMAYRKELVVLNPANLNRGNSETHLFLEGDGSCDV